MALTYCSDRSAHRKNHQKLPLYVSQSLEIAFKIAGEKTTFQKWAW